MVGKVVRTVFQDVSQSYSNQDYMTLTESEIKISDHSGGWGKSPHKILANSLFFTKGKATQKQASSQGGDKILDGCR